jgi:hypothetical protein
MLSSMDLFDNYRSRKVAQLRWQCLFANNFYPLAVQFVACAAWPSTSDPAQSSGATSASGGHALSSAGGGGFTALRDAGGGVTLSHSTIFS